jgi:hypothetical protein
LRPLCDERSIAPVAINVANTKSITTLGVLARHATIEKAVLKAAENLVGRFYFNPVP